MTGALALFVKTPGLSPVKTRLAVAVGAEAAARFHLASARAVAAVAQAVSQTAGFKSYYAVAEANALSHDYWQSLPCLWQGEGGLGERMAHVYATLLKTHDFVLLVGADIPQLTGDELISAAIWLNTHESMRFAFGPSFDGGFWLFGGNGGLPLSLWTQVTYSMPDTGAQFFSNVAERGMVKMLTTLRDVDEPEDFFALSKTLAALPYLLPEQRTLQRMLT